ncbi:Sal-like protein 4 [Plecturocebus cupreus]
MKEKLGTESVLHLKTETTLPSRPKNISYLPKGKVAYINMTLLALQGDKGAVNQWSSHALLDPVSSANSSFWVLKQILCLQQQRQQIQLTEQICIQVNSKFLQLRLCSEKAGSQGLSLDMLNKPSYLNNIPSAASSVTPWLTSFTLKLDRTSVLLNTVSQLQSALLPQAWGLCSSRVISLLWHYTHPRKRKISH